MKKEQADKFIKSKNDAMPCWFFMSGCIFWSPGCSFSFLHVLPLARNTWCGGSFVNKPSSYSRPNPRSHLFPRTSRHPIPFLSPHRLLSHLRRRFFAGHHAAPCRSPVPFSRAALPAPFSRSTPQRLHLHPKIRVFLFPHASFPGPSSWYTLPCLNNRNEPQSGGHGYEGGDELVLWCDGVDFHLCPPWQAEARQWVVVRQLCHRPTLFLNGLSFLSSLLADSFDVLWRPVSHTYKLKLKFKSLTEFFKNWLSSVSQIGDINVLCVSVDIAKWTIWRTNCLLLKLNFMNWLSSVSQFGDISVLYLYCLVKIFIRMAFEGNINCNLLNLHYVV